MNGTIYNIILTLSLFMRIIHIHRVTYSHGLFTVMNATIYLKKGSSTMVQQIQPPPEMAALMWMPVWLLPDLLPIQPSAWENKMSQALGSPPPPARWNEVPDFWFSLACHSHCSHLGSEPGNGRDLSLSPSLSFISNSTFFF